MAAKNKKQKIKIDLIAEVAHKHGYSQHNVKEIVNAFVHQVALALIEGSDVVVQELGRLTVEDKPARTVKNTFGGAPDSYVVPPYKTVRFVISPALKKKVKGRVPQKKHICTGNMKT